MQALAIMLLVAASAFIHGTIGFGFAVALTPVMLLLIDPHEAVGLSLVLSSITAVGFYLEHRPRARLRPLLPLVIGGLLGMPLGLALLLNVDERPLRLMIGVAVMLSGAATFVRGRLGQPRRPIRPLRSGVIGVLSGVMRGSVGMPGPPVLTYQHYLGGDAHQIRSQMFAFAMLLSPSSTLIAVAAGAVTRDVWGMLPEALLGLIIGVVAAIPARGRITERAFVLATVIVLLAAGGSAFASALTP